MAAAPLAIRDAAIKITRQLSLPLIDRQLTHTEGQIILSFLDRANVEPDQVDALFEELGRRGKLDQFFQTAHPRWGPYVRNWLAEHDVPWSRVHGRYQYDVHDSVDLYAGFLAGMGVSLAEAPILLAKVAKTTIDGKLVEEAQKFFKQVSMLLDKDLTLLLGEVAQKWTKDYDEYIYQFEFFKAGFHLGTTITNIALFGLGAAKVAAGLPKFVRRLPGSAKEFAAAMQRTSRRALRTAEDVARYIRDVIGALLIAPNLRHSKWLAAIMKPSDLRALLSGKEFRVLTEFGYELLYVPGRAADDAAMALHIGANPMAFVPEASVVVRRNGKIVGRIYDPRSLGHALKDVADDDVAAYLKAFDDPNSPTVPVDSDEMRSLVERARKSPEFADSALSFNPHFIADDYAEVVRQVRERMLATAKATKTTPSASVFGTLVESEMKPVLDSVLKQFPHLIGYRKAKLRDILGARLAKEWKLLDDSVESYLRQNGMLAKQIGYERNNLKQVLAASGETKLGDLEVDFFVMDPSGTQGLLLDFTSMLKELHWNKNALYHAIIGEVFPKMRLPFGEMYHFGIWE